MESKHMESNDNIEFLKKALLGFIIIFFMTYGVVISQLNSYNSDYHTHVFWAYIVDWNNLIDYLKNIISYPLWHFAVNFCIYQMKMDYYKSGALVTALFNGLTYLAILAVWIKLNTFNMKKEKMIFWAVSLLIVNPLYMPWINSNYYLGQAAPNIWHNPPHMAVKVFSVLGFGLLLILLKRKELGRKNLPVFILLTIVMLLSALAKPSFLQGFVPGIAVFILLRLIIERKKFNFKFYLGLCACFIPEVAVLLFQVFSIFFNKDYVRLATTVKIGWGDVLYSWTPSLYFSFLVTFLFPLFVLLVNFKELIKKEEIQAIICYEAVAWLESVVLYEDGIAFSFANFAWGSLVSSFVVWIFMTYYFLQNIYDPDKRDTIRKKLLLYIGFPLYTAHLMFGIVYWYNLFTQTAVY